MGVGRAEVPTPGGIYYLKELLQPPNPDGAYGVYAYGLSGFSNVLQNFNGGSGVIGIHGTNEPEKVGTDVSHGCIRLHNEAIVRMVEEIGLPLGTPVEIHGVMRRALVVALAVALAAGVAACGDDDGAEGRPVPSTMDPDDVPTTVDPASCLLRVGPSLVTSSASPCAGTDSTTASCGSPGTPCCTTACAPSPTDSTWASPFSTSAKPASA